MLLTTRRASRINEETDMSANLTFDRYDTNEWSVFANNEDIGSLTRDKPSRWHANGVGRLVEDRAAPWDWCYTSDDGNRSFEWKGGTFHDAKRKLRALLND